MGRKRELKKNVIKWIKGKRGNKRRGESKERCASQLLNHGVDLFREKRQGTGANNRGRQKQQTKCLAKRGVEENLHDQNRYQKHKRA